MIKIFAHRGFVSNKSPENSIAALDEAYNNKFDGVEFDLWFLENKIIIVHDKPNKKDILKLPTLDNFFKYKNQLDYWLDFKNMNQQNYIAIILKLKEEINKNNIDLDKIYFAPYINDYNFAQQVFDKARNVFGKNIKIVALLDNVAQYKDVKQFIKNNKIYYISIDHQLINQKLVNELEGIEILSWTIIDNKKYNDLRKIGINYFCSDILLQN